LIVNRGRNIFNGNEESKEDKDEKDQEDEGEIRRKGFQKDLAYKYPEYRSIEI
jgi:hypothetical protein